MNSPPAGEGGRIAVGTCILSLASSLACLSRPAYHEFSSVPGGIRVGAACLRDRYGRDQTGPTASRLGERDDDVQTAADKIGGINTKRKFVGLWRLHVTGNKCLT